MADPTRRLFIPQRLIASLLTEDERSTPDDSAKERIKQGVRDIYTILGVADATASTYMSTLYYMLDEILSNPDDLFVQYMQQDFKRSVFDMALNASRGDLTWKDVAKIYAPPPPVDPVYQETDATGTGAGEGLLVIETAAYGTVATDGWQPDERLWLSMIGSLDGYTQDLSAPAKAWWESVQSAETSSTDNTGPGTPPGGDAAGGAVDGQAGAVEYMDSVKDMMERLSAAVATYSLLDVTIANLVKLRTAFVLDGLGVGGTARIPDQSGHGATGASTLQEELRFIVNSGILLPQQVDIFIAGIDFIGIEVAWGE